MAEAKAAGSSLDPHADTDGGMRRTFVCYHCDHRATYFDPVVDEDDEFSKKCQAGECPACGKQNAAKA